MCRSARPSSASPPSLLHPPPAPVLPLQAAAGVCLSASRCAGGRRARCAAPLGAPSSRGMLSAPPPCAAPRAEDWVPLGTAPAPSAAVPSVGEWAGLRPPPDVCLAPDPRSPAAGPVWATPAAAQALGVPQAWGSGDERRCSTAVGLFRQSPGRSLGKCKVLGYGSQHPQPCSAWATQAVVPHLPTGHECVGRWGKLRQWCPCDGARPSSCLWSEGTTLVHGQHDIRAEMILRAH